MKKIIIIAGLSLICLYSNAQKIQKPIIDKMTGDTIIKTSEERIFTSLSWTGGETDILYTYAAKYKGSAFLIFHINVTNGKMSSVLSVSKGAKAYLKLTDGSIIELGALSDEISNARVFSGYMSLYPNTRGDTYPSFELNTETKNKLSGKAVSMIRIETSNGNMDFLIKDKNANVISKSIQLLEY